MKFERTKDGQLLDDIFVGRKNFLCPERDLNPRPPDYRFGCDHPYTIMSNHAGYMANQDSDIYFFFQYIYIENRKNDTLLSQQACFVTANSSGEIPEGSS